MENIEIVLLIVLVLSTITGYFIIRNVPSLLHTPLMSGMNALSGITLIGALLAFAIAFSDYTIVSSILGALAVFVASFNVFGGIGVTDRMLRLFKKEDHHVK